MAQPHTDRSGQIVPRKPNGGEATGLAALIQKMGPEIARALPRHISPDRMARICLTALRTTPKLTECSPASFLGAVMSCAQLGLEPNTPMGQAWLIPRKGRNGMECTLQIGYQGMIDLARRSGMVASIYAYAVREGDDFQYELGLDPKLRHVPSSAALREQQPITNVYAVAKLKDGDPIFVVLTRAQVDERRKRSAASSAGPWVTDYEAMALKTAVRVLFKWAPKSAEVARAIEIDEAPEIGRPQIAAFDETVTKALAAEGVDTSISDADFDSQPDAAPDAAPPVEQDRQPGEDE